MLSHLCCFSNFEIKHKDQTVLQNMQQSSGQKKNCNKSLARPVAPPIMQGINSIPDYAHRRFQKLQRHNQPKS